MQLLSWLNARMSRRPQTRRVPAGRPTQIFRPLVEVLEGRDLPSFAAPIAYPVSQPVEVITADVNGDGRPDLLTLTGDNGDGASVSVQLNLKKGGFGTAQTFFDYGHLATAMAVGDVNGDGKPDIVLANTDNSGDHVSQGAGYYYGSISVFLGNGKGSFTPIIDHAPDGRPIDQYVFPDTPSSLALAHMYGGSETDLVGVSADGGFVYVARPASNGHFNPADYYGGVNLGYRAPSNLAVGDVNGDGKPDVVVTEPYWNSVSVLLNNGAGLWGPQSFAVGATPTAVALGDVSGDGKLDIVTANSNGTVTVLLGQGNGSFGAAQNYAVGGPANSVALGDFNHDGRLDIATTGGTETDVLLNNGNGTFATYRKVGPAGSSVVAADFNGDSYSDLAEVVATSNSIDVLQNLANW
jgi:hypothetical protein